LKFFFEPQSVAVVGASRDPQKDGNIILQNVMNSFHGKIFPVNPSGGEICGLKAYPSLTDIPEEVDLAIIIVPAKIVPGVMEDCAKKHVRGVIIEGMGFAEVGAEGKRLQDRIVEIATKNGIRVIGPNCTGIVSKNLVTSFFKIRDVPDGNVVMIGQSGLLAAGMASDIVTNKTLNIRKFCSIGNKCDIDENDLLEFFKEDDSTRVISMYLESFRNGRRFVEIAKQVTPKKPVIVLYGGRTEAGAKAAKSHTGSIASNAKVVDAALEQTMCVKADDFNELMEFAKVFSTQPVPKGNRVAVVTAAGSVGVVLSDLCEQYGLKMMPLSKQTIDRLKGIFPEWLQPTNPIDLWFTIEKLGYTRAISESIDAALSDPEIDCVIVVIAGFEYVLELVDKRMIQEITSRHGKPVVVCMLVGDKKYKDVVQEKLGKEVPVFTSLAGGVKPLGKLCEYGMRARGRQG
jgi:acyl-CoA synthetase (NDP forming)